MSMSAALYAFGAQETFDVEVKAQHSAPMRMLIGLLGAQSDSLEAVARALQQDIEFEGHCAVECHYGTQVQTVLELQAIDAAGYPLALFLQEGKQKQHTYIDWYLYDTQQAVMITGKRHHTVGSVARGWGHAIAEVVFQALTGSTVCFSGRIAYCKDVRITGKRAVRHIYVADMTDFQGTAQSVITKSTLNIAPRWNRDPARPLLFYSEGTDRNFRLMVNDLCGHSWVSSNLDGINMQPSFSGDGKQVVFCASRGEGSTQLYAYQKGRLKRLTDHNGNALAPAMTSDGSRIYFCSDYEDKAPAIYCYQVATGAIERITRGGMAFSPHYCEANGCLVYAQSVKGVFQLFVYDDQNKMSRQLTFDGENKEECSWSPCGTYIVYCATISGRGRLVLLHVATGKKRYLTSKDEDCSYPIWSPRYAVYPAVKGKVV